MKEKYSQSKANQYFQKAREEAKNVINDPGKLENLIQQTRNKLGKVGNNSQKMNKFFQQIYTLRRMINAYLEGRYKNIPWKTLLMLTAGLIYFVTPVDLIPDFIPVTGFIDDASILFWIFNAFKKDIDDFEIWEQELSNKEF